MKKALMFVVFGLMLSCMAFSQEEGIIQTEGGVIHYKKYGKGMPILIINGGPGMNCEGFSSLATLLSDQYTAILYDQRGTGKSELQKTDSTTITMALMARDIETLRQQLHLKTWIVLGHSFGGIMAQYYASKYPESVQAMILSGSGGIDMDVFDYVGSNMSIRLSPSEKDSLHYWTDKLNHGDTTYYARYQKAKILALEYVYDRKNAPLIAERLTQGRPQVTDLVYKDLYKIKYDCKESLRNFTRPVLIIQGRQDIVGDGTAYKAHEVLKNSRLVFINECVHYGWLEQKEQYKQEIDKFLSSIQ
jgi:proline iminopeptidase